MRLASTSAIKVPVHLWDVSDDLSFAPSRAVDALAEPFRNAAMQRHSITPAQVGAKSLGHFGAFRRCPGPLLWQALLEPIEAAAPQLKTRTSGP